MARSITRRVLLIALLVAVPVRAAVVWRDAHEYMGLFAPANHRDAYQIALTPAALDEVLNALGDDQTLVRTPGAWEARPESAQDAFGTAGSYNRWRLAQLYGSRQARVVRGARTDRGRVVETWMLISPYPSTDLRTLHPGTMRLILRVSP